MNVPAAGATGVIGVSTTSDQAAVPGFAELVTALLAGSDVISDEVIQPVTQLSVPGPDENPGWSALDEDPRAGTGPEPPWQALMVHPSLVADALLRHLDQVGGFDRAPATPPDVSPIEAGVGTPSPAPVTDGRPPAPIGYATGPSPMFALAMPAIPSDPEVTRVETSVAPAPPSRPSAAPARFDPAETESEGSTGSEPKAAPPATEAAPPAGQVAIAAPPVPGRPTPDLRIDPPGPRPDRVEGLPVRLVREGENLPITPEDPTEADLETNREQTWPPTHPDANHGDTAVVPTDRTPRDAEANRTGFRSAEALSTAARRVEEAVRQLETAPPPSVVTMVIEELDLRLTVALRPDGVHLSAPGPGAQQLIGSLEEALHARGFDLSGRQRNRHGHGQPEAPVIPSPPRPTTRPVSGLRL